MNESKQWKETTSSDIEALCDGMTMMSREREREGERGRERERDSIE